MVGFRGKNFGRRNCANIHDVYANALKLTKSSQIPQDSNSKSNISPEPPELQENLQHSEPNLGDLEPNLQHFESKFDENVSDSDVTDEVKTLKVRMYLWHFNQCDVKRCTGKRLLRFGLVKELPMTQRFSGIILTPLATTLFSLSDAEIVKNKGIAVIDCSWNKITQTPLNSFQTRNGRILPFLVAGNPTHFGKPFELSCAEALASALYIARMADSAERVLSVFNWGHVFLELNRAAFELYSSKGFTSEDMLRLQEEYLQEQKTQSQEQKSLNSIDYQHISDNIT